MTIDDVQGVLREVLETIGDGAVSPDLLQRGWTAAKEDIPDPFDDLTRCDRCQAYVDVNQEGSTTGPRHESDGLPAWFACRSCSLVEAFEEDRREAAGELLVEVPEPGTDAGKLMSANVLMREDLKRTREALGLLTTLYPTVQVDVEDPVSMAKEIASFVNARIEEMQGLLVDVGFDGEASVADVKAILDTLRGYEDDVVKADDTERSLLAVIFALSKALDRMNTVRLEAIEKAGNVTLPILQRLADGIDHLRMRTPIIQGLRMQNAIAILGLQPYDSTKVGHAVMNLADEYDAHTGLGDDQADESPFIIDKVGNTSQFLFWIADRLVHVHGDDTNADFVLRLRAIATFMHDDKPATREETDAKLAEISEAIDAREERLHGAAAKDVLREAQDGFEKVLDKASALAPDNAFEVAHQIRNTARYYIRLLATPPATEEKTDGC